MTRSGSLLLIIVSLCVILICGCGRKQAVTKSESSAAPSTQTASSSQQSSAVGHQPSAPQEAIATNSQVNTSTTIQPQQLETSDSYQRENSNPSVGQIRGTITFYFNDNFRTQPDVGSKVYLLQGDWSNCMISSDEQLYNSIVIRKNYYRKTSVDGNGNFLFEKVPAGRYCVFIISSHTKGSGEPPYEKMEILGKTLQETVDVKAGESVDVSHDFGMTYF